MQDDEQVERIEGTVAPVVRHHGLTLVDLEWKGDRRRGRLRIYVDKTGGIDIGDCETSISNGKWFERVINFV